MDPQIGRAAFRIAFYLVFTAGILLLFLKPGTAEFGVTLLALLVGLIFVAAVILLLRRSSR
ncbi:MAG: hypothetical protein QHJ81_03540 [Anaerolineae bacterium]|nr:hypothetical protein [Anaerolineae bacterium]